MVKKIIYAVLVLGLYSSQAYAFGWVSSNGYGNVSFIGSASTIKQTGHTSGEDVPFASAVRLIVPKDWSLVVNGQLPKLTVSWNSESWTDTIQLLAKSFGVNFVVDVGKKQVIASYSASSDGKTFPPEPDLDRKNIEVAVGKKPVAANVISATPIIAKPALAPLPTWPLTAGDTVKKDLETWADKAHWKIVWNLSKDWIVPGSAVYNGDFETAATNVIKTLASNGAIIHAQFFEGNRTMVVIGVSE